MAKAYWVVCYREVKDQAKLAAYAKLALPALEAHGGKAIVRGIPAKTFEAGQAERTVVIEFDSLEKAIAAHDTPEYKAALSALGDGAVRDMRVIEGL